jgi:F0F1-type ATP synthase assembly protein I
MYLGDPRDARRYMTLSQVGLEMVAPIVLGLVLDYYLGWSPWCVIVGAVLGLTGGFVHLVVALNKEDPDSRPPGPSQREAR